MDEFACIARASSGTESSSCWIPAACPGRPQLEVWLNNLLTTQFFSTCEAHANLKKAEATFFCIDCGTSAGSMCQHCMPRHVGHQVLQIRRYVYCDVVRASDIAPFMDIGGIQTYIINQAKVVFLNHRPQAKLLKAGSPDACVTCQRSLREGCSFCSLACKVEHLVDVGKLGRAATAAVATAAAAAPPPPPAALAPPVVVSPSTPGSEGSEADTTSCAPRVSEGGGSRRVERQTQPRLSGYGNKRRMGYEVERCDYDLQLHEQAMTTSRATPPALGAATAEGSGSGGEAGSLGDAAAPAPPPVRTAAVAGGWGSGGRRSSDTSSDTRCSGHGGCRRKQSSPRRSPLL